MKAQDIIRAWKDKRYRDSLSEEQRAKLPPNPAGPVEVDDAQLGKVAGGTETATSRLTQCYQSACRPR